MNAMFAAFVAMFLIALAAWFGLEQARFSAADKGSGPAVRLDGE
ncbi:hypothetical protein [Sedimentitalea nanhaiensis]|uniref:Uncharacterized protein n=1 Tax=Sedimentitalea nanhaiensis TaxID=999627 RepID=A0A1I7AS89_9RHOB|nr:hypothetical protein [Sedimentitalea nanhaiensis]SFT77757.1 hypothetical protein SAMN05216236_107151 [Sedimentitalea nanhaiensis]